jgi:cellulose synthase/poly-beta-1,6-N-acetylglucosamine synthase-like glycosyltransferase
MEAEPETQPPLVSVVIPTNGERDTLAACLESVSRLDHPNFEILVCVDHSADTERRLAAAYGPAHPKVRILASASPNRGPSATRNQAISAAQGEIVFFTDDDVVVPPDWLARGLPYFDNPEVVGIEGRIVYGSEDHRHGLGDRVVENKTGGLYMTANAAYRRAPLVEQGMFDESLLHYQDRELALRMMRSGRIAYASDCVVRHQLTTHTAKTFMGEASKVRFRIMVMKKTGDRDQIHGRVYAPDKLVATLCPPLLLWRLRTHRVSCRSDWMCFLLIYPRLCYERVLVWRWAVAERTFVL